MRARPRSRAKADRGPGARGHRDRHRLRPDLLVLEERRLMATFPVTSTADVAPAANLDPGTLRWAVEQADKATSPSTIDFDLGAAAHVIRLVQGQLELSNSRYSTAIDGPAAALSVSGGGASRVFRIDPGVTASLSGLTITGGAGVLMGGGVANEGTATLYGCTISGDSASVGGGVSNQDRTTLTDCTVSGDQGSGLVNLAGDLVMTGCTISGNTSAKYGGGILNESRLALTGCTVSGNSALYGGGLDAPSSTATLNDTIVAGNVDARGASDIVGRFAARVTGGYDLIGPGGSGGIDNGSDGDIVLANLAGLGLAPLANNGGPTLTMALLPGSPAINAGSDALEVDSDGVLLAADQRGSGFPRVVAGTADVGAYEYPYLTTRISLVASGGATFNLWPVSHPHRHDRHHRRWHGGARRPHRILRRPYPAGQRHPRRLGQGRADHLRPGHRLAVDHCHLRRRCWVHRRDIGGDRRVGRPGRHPGRAGPPRRSREEERSGARPRGPDRAPGPRRRRAHRHRELRADPEEGQGPRGGLRSSAARRRWRSSPARCSRSRSRSSTAATTTSGRARRP